MDLWRHWHMDLFPHVSAEPFPLKKSVKKHMLGGALRGGAFQFDIGSFTFTH